MRYLGETNCRRAGTLWRGLLAAGISLLIGACSSPAGKTSHSAGNGDILIAVAGPMSGDLSSFGAEIRRGAEMAVADINDNGGLLGRHVSLVIGDDQCDPRLAKQLAEDFVEQGIVFVDGHFCSGSSIPASAIYATHNILQITAASTNPRLTDEAAASGWDTLFRVGGRDDRHGEFAAEYILRRYGNQPVAVLDDGSPYGTSMMRRLISTLQGKGDEPALVMTFKTKAGSDPDLVAALEKVRPGVLFIGAYHYDVARIVREMRDAGLTAEVVTGDALNTSEFARLAGREADGVRFSDAAPATKLSSAASVVRKFHADGYDPVGFVIPSYAAIQAWATGVTRAGTTDAGRVAAAMRSSPVPSAIGALSWDTKGDPIQVNYAWYIWRDGDFYQDLAN